MKQWLYHKLLLLFMPLLVLSACSENEQPSPADDGTLQTYQMRLFADFDSFGEHATRAGGYTFADKSRLYVLFRQGDIAITGTAVYAASTDLWTITPSQSLAEVRGGLCQLAFFIDAGNASSSAVTLNQQTRVYTDAAATYSLVENLLTVQGHFSPALGRIRFRGPKGQTCTVTGLSFANSFNLQTHSFVLAPSKFTATCAADGYTPYYYCAFADASKRQLTFELSATSGLRRSFGATVLQPGTSGYVTIPTVASHEGWTLVNLTTGYEIVFASLSKPSATKVHSDHATLSASVTSAGNGTLSETGFVIATHRTPTVSDRRISCSTQTQLFSVIDNLTPQMTYYVRAYAINEAGITYSEEISFTTITKEQDNSNVDHEGWDDDENWNDDSADFERETYPDDEDWN